MTENRNALLARVVKATATWEFKWSQDRDASTHPGTRTIRLPRHDMRPGKLDKIRVHERMHALMFDFSLSRGVELDTMALFQDWLEFAVDYDRRLVEVLVEHDKTRFNDGYRGKGYSERVHEAFAEGTATLLRAKYSVLGQFHMDSRLEALLSEILGGRNV